MDVYVPDHYRVLGVAVQADQAAIKDAYRKLSRVYHPDRHNGSARATECFQFISGAHSDLIDPQKRLHYDRLLVLRDPLRLVDDPRAERALDVLDLVVRRFRKKPEALPGAARGRDLRVKYTVAFATAALGGTVFVNVAYDSACSDCAGQGTREPEKNPVCHVCQGKGTVSHGLRREHSQCGFCGGRGAVMLAVCATCRGVGIAHVRRDIGVSVPARAASGSVLRVKGVGEQPALGTQPGDLVIDLEVLPHPLLTSDGDDLVLRLPLTWRQALTGGSVQVPTLEGPERLTLPTDAGTRREIRVAARGLPIANGGRGALRVLLTLDCPGGLQPEQVASVLALQDQVGDDRFAAVRDYEATLAKLFSAATV